MDDGCRIRNKTKDTRYKIQDRRGDCFVVPIAIGTPRNDGLELYDPLLGGVGVGLLL